MSQSARLTKDQQTLVIKNLPLAYSLANKTARRLSCQALLEDLAQVASQALIHAVLKFDPSKQTKLTTYAYAAITHALHDHLRRELPRRRYKTPIYLLALEDLLFADSDKLLKGDHLEPFSVPPGDEFTLFDLPRHVQAIKTALNGLPAPHKTILVDHFYHDKRFVDLVPRLEYDKSTMNRRYRQALKALKEGYTQCSR